MKKFLFLACTMLFLVGIVGAAFGEVPGMIDVKAGDKIYVCGCGETCDCGTLSKKTGKCACDKELVQSTVTKVEKGKIYYKLGDKELSASATGKYGCACGAGCDCQTVSQKPGKCSCDKPMAKAGKKTK